MVRFLKTFIIGFFTLLGISVFSFIIIVAFGLHTAIKTKEPIGNDLLLKIDLKDNFTEAQPSLSIDAVINGPSQDFYTLLLAIKQAERDKKVKGIIIQGEESNLGTAQIQELRAAILDFRKSGKSVWFHIDSFSEYTSNLKLYYLASACSSIIMQPMGSMTLHGVNIGIPYFTKNLKKLGIKSQIATREEYKDAYSSLTDDQMKPTTYESLKSLLDISFNTYIEGIVKDRELSSTGLLDVMDQVCFINASQALKLNFVDHLLYWNQAIDMIKKSRKPHMKLTDIDKYYEDFLETKLKNTNKDSDCIALIYASGVIKKDSDAYNPMMDNGPVLTPDSIEESVNEILKNPHIKSVVIRVDSPGGSAIATDSIGGQIQRLKDKKIPIIVSMGNYAASGGYWIAALADKIVASPLTVTGSIGVIGGKFSIKDMLAKFDIPVGEISSGPNSTLPSLLEDYDDKQWSLIQNDIENVYTNFIDVVAKGRKLSAEHVRQVAKGRVWLGIQAKEFGLVDQLGGMIQALSLAKELAHIPEKRETPIIVYPRQKTVFEMIELWMNGDLPNDVRIKDIVLSSIKQIFTSIKTQSTLVYEPVKIG